jgi:hypothetical protein
MTLTCRAVAAVGMLWLASGCGGAIGLASTAPDGAAGSGSDSSSGGFGSSGGSGDGSSGPSSDAGEDLDATTVAENGGDPPTSKDAQSPGACNFSNCPNGCCLADGTCFVSTGAPAPTDPCGSNGEACATCPSGYTCMGVGEALGGGACMQLLTGNGVNCSPDNCNGCCFNGSGGSNVCFEGSQNFYCGSGGATCQGCAPSTNGGHCVADPGGGGHCEGVGTCNATNCAGCCLGNVCAEGTQNVACGVAGAACQDCSSDGGICFDLGAPDGSIPRYCGYGCVTTDQPELCKLYCTSATDCTSLQ